VLKNQPLWSATEFSLPTGVYPIKDCREFKPNTQVTTDSYRPYQSIVRWHLLERLDFATLQKLYAMPFDAKGEAARRYSPPRARFHARTRRIYLSDKDKFLLRIAPASHSVLHPIAPARFPDYSHPMNNKKLFYKTNKVGLVLGAVLLAALTECVGSADGQGVSITVTPPVVVAPVVVVQDDYVYYPNYGMYYNSHRHQYAYLENGAWVLAPGPQGVTVDVLLASPSVHMDFHDSPANHHKEMLQKYPRDWKPSGVHQDQKENRKDDKRDEQGDNHGK
jgi:hypothetical protein